MTAGWWRPLERGCLLITCSKFQPELADDPFTRKTDMPALPPKRSVHPRPKPPSGGRFFSVSRTPPISALPCFSSVSCLFWSLFLHIFQILPKYGFGQLVSQCN
ncbi:hypothetical protein AMECASPLE_034544 [Ameca splendens]|uniref:Uncharacterized protein n=1 Tax=Ameca splendens TaxID=208324 RepID=A0ABV0XK44_9TELE